MYTVWVDHGTEGWHPSGQLDHLDDVYRFIGAETYGHDYRITRDVKVRHIEDTGDALSAAFAVAEAEPGSVAAAAAQRAYAQRL